MNVKLYHKRPFSWKKFLKRKKSKIQPTDHPLLSSKMRLNRMGLQMKPDDQTLLHYWSQKLLTFPKRHCVWLTYTVQTLYHTVQDTDIYCTVLYITVRFYWIVLYSTERYCTFLLTCTVQYCTTLYVLTDLYCTALNHTVQDTEHYWTVQNGYTDTYCTQLYSTERGYRHTLYTTVQ